MPPDPSLHLKVDLVCSVQAPILAAGSAIQVVKFHHPGHPYTASTQNSEAAAETFDLGAQMGKADHGLQGFERRGCGLVRDQCHGLTNPPSSKNRLRKLLQTGRLEL